MGRTVSAHVTADGEGLGTIGPFPVDSPWWAETGPVVARLRRALGVPVVVLRLLEVEGGEGGRDGHVTYHVEALGRPAPGLLSGAVDHDALTAPEPSRAPWARLDGLRELLDWASDALAGLGRPVTGPAEQHRTWNLSGVFRLPTAAGPVWVKALPAFAADEAAAIAALARIDPGIVPAVLAAGNRRLLMEDLPGEDCWNAAAPLVVSAVSRMAAAQARYDGGGEALPDRRPPVLAGRVAALLDERLAGDLTEAERAAAHRLNRRWEALAECGLPATLVHGDFHPGNWRSGGGPPVVLDFADAHVGDPVLDGLRAFDYLPGDRKAVAARAWAGTWRRHRPRSRPERALALAEPLAHLAYAVRYQEFLDGVEPSERIYHLDDPVSCVREALRVAREPSPYLGAGSRVSMEGVPRGSGRQ
ncbi:aminoglycoside phosphotransferase family protein [Actinomadura kijaniata]|uniref:aminoglycoside phosphotransferase family protein n=1 Tax=Actinomadura kijaniata TaxID=46161 RepID=UPI003F194CF0